MQLAGKSATRPADNDRLAYYEFLYFMLKDNLVGKPTAEERAGQNTFNGSYQKMCSSDQLDINPSRMCDSNQAKSVEQNSGMNPILSTSTSEPSINTSSIKNPNLDFSAPQNNSP